MRRTLCYSYSKQENLTIDDPEILQFTHLLMEAKSKYSPNIKPYLKTHDIIDSVDGFSHITLNHNMLPPIKIKTKPSIFIMKRKSNIKYDPDKAPDNKLWVSMKDFSKQIDDTENIELKISHETAKIMEPILKDISESLEEFGGLEETGAHNFSPEIDKINEATDQIDEEMKRFDNFVDIGMTSVENITEINDIDESLPNLKNKKEKFDYQDNVEDVTDSNNIISDEKFDESKIEKGKIIKGKLKNFNSRQENHGIKEMVKKIIQEKMLEVKQKREVNEEREIMEHIIESMMEMKTGIIDEPKMMKKALEETSAYKDKSKEVAKDESKQKVIRTRNVTWKMDKIKIKKPVILEEKAKYMIIEPKDEVTDKMKKNVKIQDRVNTESSTKPINVRESIKNIINQFKEFEKDFIYDDTDSTTPINDIYINNVNHIEEKSRIEKDNVIMDHPIETENQLVIKDARESLKEILDQFKHIKHELTSEEDDQFDEIATTYLERPIAETLLKFSEALKSLMQRRKKISLHENNLYDDKSHMTMLKNQEDLMIEEITRASTKEYTKEAKIIENDHKNGKLTIAKIKSRDKQDSGIADRHDANMVPSANKYIDALTSTEDVSLNAQRYNNAILNNTNKADNMRKESSQNIENNKSD